MDGEHQQARAVSPLATRERLHKWQPLGQLLIFRNYNPGDLAQIWGNNHINAGAERGIVARIDYTRALSRVTTPPPLPC